MADVLIKTRGNVATETEEGDVKEEAEAVDLLP